MFCIFSLYSEAPRIVFKYVGKEVTGLNMMRAFVRHQRATSKQLCSDALNRANTLGAMCRPAKNGLYSSLGVTEGMHSWGRVVASKGVAMSVDRKHVAGGLRGYGSSSYHFSAAEKEESAILSDVPSDEDSGEHPVRKAPSQKTGKRRMKTSRHYVNRFST